MSIFEAMQRMIDKGELKATFSCCSTPCKFCNTDEWRGNLEGFVKGLLKELNVPLTADGRIAFDKSNGEM